VSVSARFAWALVLVAACSFDSLEAESIDNSCSSDASCEQGICSGGICVDDSGQSVSVAIEVIRSGAESQQATPASWAFAPEDFAGPSARNLALPAVRQVQGSVRWEGIRVPAAIRFVRKMAGAVEPLTPLPVEVETFRQPIGDGGPESYDFSAVLVAGESYEVAVLPSNEMVMAPGDGSTAAIRALPPLYLELEVGEGDYDEPVRFDVTFPEELLLPCTPTKDVLCTLQAFVIGIDSEGELPEAGLQVRAVEKETGRVLSSIAETDETGSFAIRINDAAPDYLIRVTSSVGQDPFPAVSVDPDIAFAGDPAEKLIYVPRLARVQFQGSVRDTNEAPVPRATLRFLSTGIFDDNELGLQGSFSATTMTNDDGSFSLELLPGVYSVTVTPPEDVENAWGTLSAEALVAEVVTATEALIVPPQVDLRGLVTTFVDEPAVGATLDARARVHEDANGLHRSEEAVSNSMGAFAMSMDGGLYDMHVKVPPESGFGWLVEPELIVDPDVGEAVRSYELVPPIPVDGVVTSADGSPVAGALLRAYVLSATGTEARQVQVAEAVSDADGAYRLLITPDFVAE
jgi:hypothetical protein